MGKSILSLLKGQKKDDIKEKQRDFKKRQDAFFEEYKILANKYKCDWNPFIVVDRFGQQAKPHLEIIDATSFLEKEDEDKKEFKK